jgi:hypothetical protein
MISKLKDRLNTLEFNLNGPGSERNRLSLRLLDSCLIFLPNKWIEFLMTFQKKSFLERILIDVQQQLPSRMKLLLKNKTSFKARKVLTGERLKLRT